MDIFYHILKSLKKVSKKYINRKFLVGLVQLKPKNIAYRMLTKPPIRKNKAKVLPYSTVLTPDEFRRGMRTLMVYFLNHYCTESIITSKKLNKETWG